jgi:hypothetical protein
MKQLSLVAFVLVLVLGVIACDDKKNDVAPTPPGPTLTVPLSSQPPASVPSAADNADASPPPVTHGLPSQVDEAANASKEISAGNYKKELESLSKEIKELK